MSITLSNPPAPTPMVESSDPLVKLPPLYISMTWLRWLNETVMARVQTAPYATASLSLTAQSASLGLTSLVAAAVAGLYRVSYSYRVTQAASTSSSLLVTVTTTDGTVAVTQASAAYTGNDVSKPQSGSFVVRCDANAPLQVSTTYASVGATPMLYQINVIAEAL